MPGEERHAEPRLLARRHLAAAVHVDRLIKLGQQVGPPPHQLVVHGRAAHDHALAAFLGAVDAEQAHDIAGIGMEAELGGALGQPPVVVLLGVADIDDVADDMAVAVLGDRIADVARESPVDADQGLAVVALDRQALDVAEAQARADLRPERAEPRRQPVEREVVAPDLLDAKPALARGQHRRVDLGDIGRGQPADPVVALHDLGHRPGEAAADRSFGHIHVGRSSGLAPRESPIWNHFRNCCF